MSYWTHLIQLIKPTKNKINTQNKNLVYDGKHSFAKFKHIDDIKKLSLNSMH